MEPRVPVRTYRRVRYGRREVVVRHTRRYPRR